MKSTLVWGNRVDIADKYAKHKYNYKYKYKYKYKVSQGEKGSLDIADNFQFLNLARMQNCDYITKVMTVSATSDLVIP